MAGLGNPGDETPFATGAYEVGGDDTRNIVPAGETIGSAAAKAGYSEVESLSLQNDEVPVIGYDEMISGLLKAGDEFKYNPGGESTLDTSRDPLTVALELLSSGAVEKLVSSNVESVPARFKFLVKQD